MIYPDYHVHSNFSFDGIHPVHEIVRAAASRRIPEIGFTDHLEFDPSNDAFGGYDYEAILQTVEEARLGSGSAMPVRLGVEVGFDPRHLDKIRQYLEAHPFDYVSGAVHTVEGMAVGEPLFKGREADAAYRLYFKAVLQAVESGLFDVLAHLDLPKRYGIGYYGRSWNAAPFREELSAIFRSMIEMDMTLEVNTSGLRQDPRETYPGVDTLELYRNLGGEKVLLGSDAHRSWDLAYGFEETGILLRKLGFSEVQRFGDRSRPIRP